MPLLEPSQESYRQILRLRTVRRYLPKEIAGSELEAILQAARWTGSSKNSQPWAFVVVRDDQQREALATAGRFSTPIAAAPLVIAIVRLPGGHDFDMGRAAQNMMLAAQALGIGSCPVTLHEEDRARDVLGVPSDHGCRWAVAFGYADEEGERQLRRRRRGGRRPLDDLVLHEMFRE